MVGRILRSADFERVLSQPPRSRSAHFAAHHVPAVPSRARASADETLVGPVVPQLSTAGAPGCPPLVDDLPGAVLQAAATESAPLAGWWLGTVVPKRHARRAVTRNLIKRQMRSAMARLALQLPAGLWVLRLRAPFDPKAFPSAASQPLRQVARGELQQLLEGAVLGTARPGGGRRRPAREART